ncbi:hypothetical protein [Fusobacterium sp.]|uniref:hypothetical protein n=1 Tax=Fusobacterium sp. TaxID=68766 RepID=UPI002901DCC8|nr:hypothetical protein [Fusobacterium sp.]MDU1910985.1 hypothetical protein [Fusobacterium sp.]
MIEKRKRGRPLGSGVKNYSILGCRFTEKEYLLIQKSLKKLKEEYKTNHEIILNLFKKYGKDLEKKGIHTILEEKYNDKINKSRIRTTER